MYLDDELATACFCLPYSSLLTCGDFPVDELVEFAIREGRRPRPIYTAHKWFARRLGTVFRALLIGGSIPPEKDFWEAYYGDSTLRGCKVLDPFVGGGTSLFEAHRLGATVYGVDVDPVACAVTRLELDAANIESLEKPLESLKKAVGDKIQKYHIHVGEDGESHQVLHHFWVQRVSCGKCGFEYDAHPNYRLAKDDSEQWVFCSECGDILKRHPSHKSFRCDSCNHRTYIEEGRLNHGRTTCPHCRNSEDLIQIGRRTQAPPEWRVFAVETIPTPKDRRPIPIRNRTFRSATRHSDLLFTKASEEYEKRRVTHPHTFPDMLISTEDRADTRLIDYGYRNWVDVYNHRQLLHLSLLSEAILELPKQVQTPLAMAFSNHLTTNCMLTSYAAGWRRLTPLFSLRSFRHVPRPIELNPWVERTGRGTFPNAVRQLTRASNYAKSPREPQKDGKFVHVPPVDAIAPGQVHCGTARKIDFLESESIDLVLTDPPYYDNIAYSELAEFFHPWLHTLEVLNSHHNINVIKQESIIGRRGKAEALRRYTENLCAAFSEASRTLKKSGLMAFSFRHVLPEAWKALAYSLASNPLLPVRVLPAPGEAGTGLHNHSGTGLWDAVLIFRKGPKKANCQRLGVTDKEYQEAVDDVAAWADRLRESALPFNQVDKAALLRATIVSFSLRNSQPDSSTDKVIPLDEALSLH